MKKIIDSTMMTDSTPTLAKFKRRMHAGWQRGFTLIEILVVIALTVILFGILLRPLISALQYSREAQTLTAAQDSARKVVEMLTRELGSATYVLDNHSHAFNATAQAANADLYTNFIDMEIPTSLNNRAIAHCYDAKLDYVSVRHVNGAAVDPTSKEPINFSQNKGFGSTTLNGTNTLTSVAPGNTLIRWFPGLKDPTKPYSNENERLVSSGGLANNTYVLYRVQAPLGNFPKTTVNPNGVNTDLFELDSNNAPILDDPDFFRYVKAGTDVNWTSADHHAFTASEVAAHNTRVDNWQRIAKPVITAPEVDLLLLPRTTDGEISYDQTGPFTNIAHFGVATDPVAGAATDPVTGDNSWPIVRSSVVFRPSGVPEQAVPGTTSEYGSAGAPADAADTGFAYAPTVYVANHKLWASPYEVTLAPPVVSANTPYFKTSVNDAPLSQGPVLKPIDTGDIVEDAIDGSGNSLAVYDVTKQQPIFDASGANYVSPTFVPMSLDPDRGTINFAFRAIPPPISGGNPNNVFWTYPTGTVNQGGGTVDLKSYAYNAMNYSPLGPTYSASPTAPTGRQITNAHVVRGSVRVVAPDSTSGPDFGKPTEYTQVFGQDTPGPNQFRVDYDGGFVQFHQVQAQNGAVISDVPETFANGGAAGPINISYDYQANMTANAGSTTPLTVSVDYQTRDIMDVQIGVRVYTPGSSKATVIVDQRKINVGNSNR